MDYVNLKNLLLVYENKRNAAIAKASKKKASIYSQNSRLQEIDDELSKCAIETAKSLLMSTFNCSLQDLNAKKSKLKLEKEKILKSMNYSLDDFKPIFECSKCNDTGYIQNGYKTEMCSCLKQQIFNMEYNTYNVYNMQNQTFDNFKDSFYCNEVNTERYNSTVSPRDNILFIKKICNKFIKNFDSKDEKNLLFTGNSGLGKTFLSNCIANKLLSEGKTVLYQTAPVMLDNVLNYKLGKAPDNLNLYKNLLSVDLLIIDDLGTESMNNLKFAELFTIINSRLLPQNSKSTKTIISTNLDLNELSKAYGERIVSRFAGNYNICHFYGDDIRFKK